MKNKYIRTKLGVYEIDAKTIIAKVDGRKEIYTFFDNTPVIAEADTIEELCDEFVVIEETQNYVMEICSYKTLKDNGWIGSGFTIHGAIWTDKGLIYVAKLNDKGDLELI